MCRDEDEPDEVGGRAGLPPTVSSPCGHLHPTASAGGRLQWGEAAEPEEMERSVAESEAEEEEGPSGAPISSLCDVPFEIRFAMKAGGFDQSSLSTNDIARLCDSK